MDKPLFRGFLTVLFICFSAAFLAYAAFFQEYEDPSDRMRLIDTIVGFILGAAITPLIQFYFGSSQETEVQRANTTPPVVKPDSED